MSKCGYCHKNRILVCGSKEFNNETLIRAKLSIPLDSRYLDLHIFSENIFIGYLNFKKKIRYCPMCGRDLKNVKVEVKEDE